MKRVLNEVAVVFAISLALRLLIFFPTFIQGGDLGQFATFVREINIDGGVPTTNNLYFPGSTYIYPPLLFLFVNGINSLFHPSFDAILVMREMLAISAVASSLTASIIYIVSRSEGHGHRNFIIAAVAVFFMPDLYALSWGGDPFMLGEFLFIISLAVLNFRASSSWKWVFISSITLTLLALTHDMTWFFSMLVMLLIIVYDAIKKNLDIAAKDLIPFLSSLAVGLVWWVPRLKFVYDAFFITESSGYGSYIPVSSTISFVTVFLPFAVAVVGIAIFSLYRSDLKLSRVKWDTYVISLMASLVFLVFIFKSPTLGGRIMYFSMIFGTVVVLRLFSKTSGPSPGRRNKTSGKSSRLSFIAVFVLVIASIPLQGIMATGSTSYYKSGYYQYDTELLQWGQTHFTNGTVVAPNIGNYISAADGVPVIVYGNFLIGGTQIEQRNAATYVVMNPGNQTSITYLHQYDIKYLVVTTSFLQSQKNGNFFPAPQYREVYSDSYYSVVEYTG